MLGDSAKKKKNNWLLLKKGWDFLEAGPCGFGPMNITVERLHKGSDVQTRPKVDLRSMKSDD